MRTRDRSVILAVVGIAAAILPASSQSLDPAVPRPTGPVRAIATREDNVYFGGSFDFVGAGFPVVGGAVVAVADGAPIAALSLTGIPKVVVEDGHGGYFVGGDFVSFNGVSRSHLVHLRPDLSVDAWNPAPDREVSSLAVAGNVLYVGGSFRTIAGQPRSMLAAFRVSDQTLTSWNPAVTGYRVNALALRDSLVYVGGWFTDVLGVSRPNLACVTRAGSLTPWSPAPSNNVHALLVGEHEVYAAGLFHNVGGVPNQYVARIDRTTGMADSWGQPVGNQYWAFLDYNLARYGDILYVSGQFIDGLAALDATTGERLTWSPAPSDFVSDIALSGDVLFAAGAFRRIGGQTRYRFAAFDAASGDLVPWRCNADSWVMSIETIGDRIWAFGPMRQVAGTVYRNVAAVHGPTGQWLPWNPEVEGPVLALEAGDGVIYAGGGFATIGGTARSNLAAFDAETGAVTDFVADVDDTVRALALQDGTLYAGGDFAAIGATSRARLVAVDAMTGAVTSWNPSADGSVRSLEPAGPEVLVAGRFTHAGGAARKYLARLDAVTGAADAWNPSPSFWVDVVRARGSTIYCGGLFASIGGATRYFAGAVDATTGLATPWDPNLGQGTLTCLDVSTPAVHAGGNFATVGGEPRQGIAAFDAAGVLVAPWSVTGTGTVHAIAVHDGTVYVGGDGTFSDGTTSRPYFTAITGAAVDAPAPVAGAPAWRLEPVRPNPLAGSGMVRLELPRASVVEAAVFDVAGRRVLDLVRAEVLTAGVHQLPVERGRLGSGVYFVRVEAAGRTSSTKFVVAPRR